KRQDPFTGEIVTTYQVVRADIDEETLAAIAKTTGGAYFRATTAKTMGDVLARIDTLEKTRLTAPKSEKVDELYFRPLAAGMPAETRELNRALVVDVSLSMAAEDVGTSRLDAAKAIAKRIIAAHSGRVGLVVFENGADVVSPLTSDGDAVAALVDSLQPGEVS